MAIERAVTVHVNEQGQRINLPGAALTLIAPGSKVRIGEDIAADVVGVHIGSGLVVQYHCTWWDGNESHAGCLEAWQVKAKEDAKELRIGFEGK